MKHSFCQNKILHDYGKHTQQSPDTFRGKLNLKTYKMKQRQITKKNFTEPGKSRNL